MSKLQKNQNPTHVITVGPRGQMQEGYDDQSHYLALLEEENEKARKSGFLEGEKSGYKKAKEESLAIYQMLQTIAQKFLEQKNALIEQLKPEIVEMAIIAAEKVIRVELSQREKLVKLIDSFLQIYISSFQAEVVKIFLNPEDLATFESAFKLDKKEIKSLRFCPDKNLLQGDFRIESKSSLLNFNINRELEDLRAKILRYA